MEKIIEQRTRDILRCLPPGVEAVAAGKTRTAEEVAAAVRGGIKIIGHNYLQEAARMLPAIGRGIRWHFIGRIQKNKIKKMLDIFDMIETLDSARHCETLEKHLSSAGRHMPVLVQVNIAGEHGKAGVSPRETPEFMEEISRFPHIRVQGLMTMGPPADEEESRKYFRMMKKIFDEIREMRIPGIEMRYLSMGMSRTYKTAVEEGANLVRIGTGIFGERTG